MTELPVMCNLLALIFVHNKSIRIQEKVTKNDLRNNIFHLYQFVLYL